MFAQSYNPFGFDHLLYYNTFPRAYEKRKRREKARRQRMIRADRRRQAEVEWLRCMDEKLRKKEKNRRRKWKLAEEEGLRQHRFDLLEINARDYEYWDDTMTLSSLLQSVNHANIPQSDHHNYQEYSHHLPRAIYIALKPESHLSAPRQYDKKLLPRRCLTDIHSIDTKENQQHDHTSSQTKIMQESGEEIQPNIGNEDDGASAPPHIIAVENLSDDEEDEALQYNWIHRAPASPHTFAVENLSDGEVGEELESWVNQVHAPGDLIVPNAIYIPHFGV